MTPRQLLEYAQAYNLEDAEIYYPLYETECDLAKVTLAKTIVTSDEKPSQIILLNI